MRHVARPTRSGSSFGGRGAWDKHFAVCVFVVDDAVRLVLKVRRLRPESYAVELNVYF